MVSIVSVILKLLTWLSELAVGDPWSFVLDIFKSDMLASNYKDGVFENGVHSIGKCDISIECHSVPQFILYVMGSIRWLDLEFYIPKSMSLLVLVADCGLEAFKILIVLEFDIQVIIRVDVECSNSYLDFWYEKAGELFHHDRVIQNWQGAKIELDFSEALRSILDVSIRDEDVEFI